MGRDVRFLLYREHPSRFYEREGCFLATYTENFGLHQWVPEDDFLRTDFNTDFQKIDAAIKGVETGADTALALKADAGTTQTALAAKAEIAVGAYTGDGTESRTITLGFQPKALLLFRRKADSGNDRYTLLVYPDAPCISTNDGGVMLAVAAQGFSVRYATYRSGNANPACMPVTNGEDIEYRYLAVK